MAGVMKSLVDRLLEVPFVGFVYEGLEGVEDPSVCREAAERIVELEAALEKIAGDPFPLSWSAQYIARAALEGKANE